MFCTNCGSSKIKNETDHYYHNDMGFDYQCENCEHRFSLSANEELIHGLITFCIQHKKLPPNILIPKIWYDLLTEDFINVFKSLRIFLTPDNEIQSLVLIDN